MSRPPKPKVSTNSELLNSLKALSQITTTVGQPYETHVILKDNWATVFNGIIGGGERITESLNICPHNELIIAALSKCGQQIAFTQLDNGRLSVKSDKFRAIVPCLNSDDMPPIFPDPPVAQLDDRLKAAILAVAPLAEEGETDILTASLLIHGGCVTATDRRVIVQQFHGIDLPPMLAVPQAIIKPLIKNQKQLAQFGYSNSSCTFYYADGSWLKTALFAKQWPDINSVLDVPCNPWPLPEDFYKAVRALEPFSETGNVYFDAGVMRSHSSVEAGASYELYGLPKGPIFDIKQLKLVEPFIETIDFMATGKNGNPLSLWFGKMTRGAIAGRELGR